MLSSRLIYTSIVHFCAGVFWLQVLATTPAKAQNYSVEDVKAALLVNIIKNLQFPEEDTQSAIRILIWQDGPVTPAFSSLANVSIRKKHLDVQANKDSAALELFDVVYIPQAELASLSAIAVQTRGKGVLLVTEESQSLHNVMINIELQRQDAKAARLSFQINRPNIAFEKIGISPDLVLFGGSEIDIAELYYETEKAILALRQQNQSTFERLQQQQQAYDDIQQEYARLQSQLGVLSKELDAKQTSIQTNESRLAALASQIQSVEQQYQQAQQLAEQKTTELREAESALAQYDENVRQQKQLLEKLENEVQANNVLLKRQESQLDEAKTEVKYQSELIDKQRDLIYIVLAIVAIAIISAVAITYLFLKNKRTKDKLASALSHLTEAKEQLVEAEKMASLGQLVTGVAHEINTPIGNSLTAISTLGAESRLFKQQLMTGNLKKSEAISFADKLEKLDELVEGNLQRCRRLVENFKLISGDQIVEQKRDIHVREYCATIMTTLTSFLQQHHVNWQVEGDNPLLHMDPGLLGQVIAHFATNAVTHAFANQDDRRIAIDISVSDNKCKLIISDNGIGLTDDIRQRVFDPFFTTKRGEGATGLGLNIVYTIVTTKLNGTIDIDSTPGTGTRFIIYLPIQ